ncbi:hypothetical protein Noc_1938 [Nitrosococcus oceani ATCC 19707]|uniref:Uncharacterized protein n=2 Tax=Nitrosococcus oceani TaxID=1229 RepID=Q3J9U6_NITOC|nr:hypothetical protein Noc_1938 [Nitrosococcus oceani ATCC 19707]
MRGTRLPGTPIEAISSFMGAVTPITTVMTFIDGAAPRAYGNRPPCLARSPKMTWVLLCQLMVLMLRHHLLIPTTATFSHVEREGSPFQFVYRAHRLLQRGMSLAAVLSGPKVARAAAVPIYNAVADSQAGVGWDPQWLEIDIAAGIQATSNGQANHGWRLVSVSGNSNLQRFRSNDYTADPTLMPKLTIVYTND